MSELTTVSASSITSSEDVLKAAILGISTIVELRPGTLALAENGLQVQKLIDAITPDLELADTITIDSADMLTEAEGIAGRLATVCADSGSIESERKALTSPFGDLTKKINAGYNEPRAYIGGVLSGLKTKILAYHSEQQRIAREAEAEAARLREQAAIEAAATEAEASKAAEDLLAQAQAAQAKGSDITASALIHQAQTRLDESRQAADVAVAALHTRTVTAPVAIAKGVRGTWKGVVLDKSKLLAHIAARVAAGDPSLLHLIDVNESNLNKLASMQKQDLLLPGVKAEFEQSLSVRKTAVAA